MRFLADLRRELAARGIRGRLAERIEAELADHLACDPAARLGDPAEIAERFAAELRVVRSRRAVWETFAALAVCAALLGVAERHPAGGASWAGIVVAVSAQIAFVAGCLALLRGVRARTAGDFHLAQRRAAVALVAGAGVAAGMAGEGRLLAYVCAAAAAVPLVVAASATRRAALVTAGGDSEGLAADLGPHARRILLALGAVAVAGVVVQGVVFEGSGWEGLIRGAVEAGGLVAGVVALGRVLGLRA
jgi:hypothetical protein